MVCPINFTFIRNDLEVHETRNISDRKRRFGASCAIIKVTNHFLSLPMYLIRRLGRAAIAADAIF